MPLDQGDRSGSKESQLLADSYCQRNIKTKGSALKSSKFELAAVAAAAAGQKLAPSPARNARRPSGVLVITAVSARKRPKGPIATEGGCRGVLAVADCTVEATDGHLLGLAARVLNVGAVTVQVSKRPGDSWRVKSNAHFHAGDIEQMGSSEKAAERNEAWFVKRFATALFNGHYACRQPPGVMDWWSTNSLPQVLRLVPLRGRSTRPSARGIASLVRMVA
jgi:hypothetical protein